VRSVAQISRKPLSDVAMVIDREDVKLIHL
jgi:hypothetical protein